MFLSFFPLAAAAAAAPPALHKAVRQLAASCAVGGTGSGCSAVAAEAAKLVPLVGPLTSRGGGGGTGAGKAPLSHEAGGGGGMGGASAPPTPGGGGGGGEAPKQPWGAPSPRGGASVNCADDLLETSLDLEFLGLFSS